MEKRESISSISADLIMALMIPVPGRSKVASQTVTPILDMIPIRPSSISIQSYMYHYPHLTSCVSSTVRRKSGKSYLGYPSAIEPKVVASDRHCGQDVQLGKRSLEHLDVSEWPTIESAIVVVRIPCFQLTAV